MDKPTLERLLFRLPSDATEISIPTHESTEIIFSSDIITKNNAQEINALPAQRGTYHGSKRRWRIKDTFALRPRPPENQTNVLEGTTQIDLTKLPTAEETSGNATKG